MSKRQSGFTLIELMIVVAIIAIIASIAIPNLLSARLNANESAAIATLKNILSSQAQMQATGVIDANQNGAGEYGFFGELSAGTAVRNDEVGGIGTEFVSPPVLSPAFSLLQGSRVYRSGYVFQLYLPDAAGVHTAEAATGGASGISISASNSEVLWCCYAWPARYGNTGRRTFFVSQGGDVLYCANRQRYNGVTNLPAPNAAYIAGSADVMNSTISANTTGKDGERWIVVN